LRLKIKLESKREFGETGEGATSLQLAEDPGGRQF